MPHWRALQVTTRREQVAADALAQLQIPVVLPKILFRRRPTTPQLVLRPIWPGYLFADIDGKSYASVKRADAVINIIGTVPIPPFIVEGLALPYENVCFSPRLVPGNTYRLNRGALLDAIVRFIELDEHGQAAVIVQLFGAEHVVRVSPDNLEEQ